MAMFAPHEERRSAQISLRLRAFEQQALDDLIANLSAEIGHRMVAPAIVRRAIASLLREVRGAARKAKQARDAFHAFLADRRPRGENSECLTVPVNVAEFAEVSTLAGLLGTNTASAARFALLNLHAERCVTALPAEQVASFALDQAIVTSAVLQLQVAAQHERAERAEEELRRVRRLLRPVILDAADVVRGTPAVSQETTTAQAVPGPAQAPVESPMHLDRASVEAALRSANGIVHVAAAILGQSLSTVHGAIERFHIDLVRIRAEAEAPVGELELKLSLDEAEAPPALDAGAGAHAGDALVDEEDRVEGDRADELELELEQQDDGALDAHDEDELEQDEQDEAREDDDEEDDDAVAASAPADSDEDEPSRVDEGPAPRVQFASAAALNTARLDAEQRARDKRAFLRALSGELHDDPEEGEAGEPEWDPPAPPAPRARRSLETIGATEARPQTRADCLDGPRPCPWVSCRFHLYMDVAPDGTIVVNFPDVEPEDMEHTCVLDRVDAGAATIEQTGAMLGITREQVRQVEKTSLEVLVGHRGRTLHEFVADLSPKKPSVKRVRLPVAADPHTSSSTKAQRPGHHPSRCSTTTERG